MTIFVIFMYTMLILIALSVVGAVCKVISALLTGYTVSSFSFAGFMIKYDGKKLSFTTAPARLIAAVTCLRKDITRKIRVTMEVINWVLVLLVCCAIAYLASTIGNVEGELNRAIVVAAGVYVAFCTIAMIITLAPAFSKGAKRDLWESELKTLNSITNGVRPKDYPMLHVDDAWLDARADRCRLYNYYHLLDSGQYESLCDYIHRFKGIIGNVDNIISFNVPYAYEIVYYYSVIEPDINMAEHYVELLGELLVNDMDINGRRVYAAYLAGAHRPKDAIRRVIEQGLYKTDRDNFSIANSMEVELLSELKEKVNGGKFDE